MRIKASKNAKPLTGRPAKNKGPLRNFKFLDRLDAFLSAEAERTGRDMTMILESVLHDHAALKPAARDARIDSYLRERAS